MKNEISSARASRRTAGLHGLATLILFAVIVVVVNVLAFKHYWHRDLSQSQFYTLSPKTADVLHHLESHLTVTTILVPNDHSPINQEAIDDLLKEYERTAGKNITVQNVDAAYDMARAEALQKQFQFDGSGSLIILQYKGHDRMLKESELFDVNPMTQQIGTFKGEQQLTGALVALIEGKASKVYFTEGHGEHPVQDADSATGYGVLAQTIKSENIETQNLNLASKGDVPADADALVIAGPQIAFSPSEAQALDRYLAGNGKLLILADPYAPLGLEDLLKRYGMQYDNDVVLYRVMTTTGEQLTLATALIYQGGFSSHPITSKFATANLQMQIPAARSITLLKDAKGQPNPKVQSLLQTDPDAWGWVSKPNAPPPADIRTLTFDKTTDLPGPLVLAAVYDGGTAPDPKTQAPVAGAKIVAVGCSKFLENSVADQISANFFDNALDWLVKKNAVLDIAPKIPQEYGLSLSPMQSRTVQWTALIVIPGIALVLALFTWLSRRK